MLITFGGEGCCFGGLGYFLWGFLFVFIRKYLVLFLVFVSSLDMELGTRLI